MVIQGTAAIFTVLTPLLIVTVIRSIEQLATDFGIEEAPGLLMDFKKSLQQSLA